MDGKYSFELGIENIYKIQRGVNKTVFIKNNLTIKSFEGLIVR